MKKDGTKIGNSKRNLLNLFYKKIPLWIKIGILLTILYLVITLIAAIYDTGLSKYENITVLKVILFIVVIIGGLLMILSINGAWLIGLSCPNKYMVSSPTPCPTWKGIIITFFIPILYFILGFLFIILKKVFNKYSK